MRRRGEWREKSEIIGKEKEEEELGSRGQKRNVGKAKKQGQGRRIENERRTKRKRKGGEWEERMVSFDINSRIIKAVIVCEPHLGETDSPICLSNLFIRFCLSPFRDLKWQCTMDA